MSNIASNYKYIWIYIYILILKVRHVNTVRDERFIVEGYVEDILPKVSFKDGRTLWVVILTLTHQRDGDFYFEFVTYYDPAFDIGDLIRLGISRRGDATVSSCAPFIVEKGVS